MTTTRLALALTLVVAAPATALAQLPVGTAVGFPASSGYDSGGRRDPFVSLIVTKKTTTEPSGPMTHTLRGLALADAKLTGILKAGDRYLATLEAPDKRSYSIRVDDRLLDAVVKRIEADAVVFVELDANPYSGTGPREVRKTLRPAAEVVR
jgi:Tfp pilus assembly protein PilP